MNPKTGIDLILTAFSKDNKLKLEREYRFKRQRLYRSDWAFPEIKVLIEYEGLISTKSRHVTITGFSNDCVKYNLATIEGWKVLRYTVLTWKNVGQDLNMILKGRKEIMDWIISMQK